MDSFIFLGMVSFFVFWGTLLFHIWPPSLYWPQDLMFWKETANLETKSSEEFYPNEANGLSNSMDNT